mgnify:CR=1 FL=1
MHTTPQICSAHTRVSSCATLAQGRHAIFFFCRPLPESQPKLGKTSPSPSHTLPSHPSPFPHRPSPFPPFMVPINKLFGDFLYEALLELASQPWVCLMLHRCCPLVVNSRSGAASSRKGKERKGTEIMWHLMSYDANDIKIWHKSIWSILVSTEPPGPQ